MREYLISTGIVCLVLFTLYTLYNYNKYIVQFDEKFYKENLKNKFIIVMMTFIKTSIVMSIFIYLVYTMKIMIFG